MMRTMFAVAGAALALTGCAAYPGDYGYNGYGYDGYGYPARSSASVYAGGYSYGRPPNYGYGYGYAPNYGYAPRYGYAPSYGYAPYSQPYYVVPGGRYAPTDTQRAYRQDRREDRQEFRQDRREDRREFRAAREAGVLTPELRQAYRQERREDRREFRQERREDRDEFRGGAPRARGEVGRAIGRELRERGLR